MRVTTRKNRYNHKKLLLERYLSSKIILLIDLMISVFASAMVLFILGQFRGLTYGNWGLMTIWMLGSLLFSFAWFYILRTYKLVISHSTLREVAKFALAAIGKELSLVPRQPRVDG